MLPRTCRKLLVQYALPGEPLKLHDRESDAAVDQARRLGQDRSAKPEGRPADATQPRRLAPRAKVIDKSEDAGADGNVGGRQAGMGQEARLTGQQCDRQPASPPTGEQAARAPSI